MEYQTWKIERTQRGYQYTVLDIDNALNAVDGVTVADSGSVDGLDTLCYLMRLAQSDESSPIREDDLPTFGGDPIDETDFPVWSWDAERVLVGDGGNNIEIISRDEFAGMLDD